MENKKLSILVVFSFCVAIFSDFFVRGYSGGIGLVLVLLLFVFGLIFIAHKFLLINNRWAFWFFIPMIIFVFDLLLYNNTLVTAYLPKVFIFVTLILLTIVAVRGNSKDFLLRNFLLFRHLSVFFRANLTLIKRLRFIFFNTPSKSLYIFLRVFLGILISLPFLAIFVLLFSKADVIFLQSIDHLFDLFEFKSLVLHIFYSIFLACLILFFIYPIFSEDNSLEEVSVKQPKKDTVIAFVVLFLVNIVFCLFVFVQFKYLFGGAHFIFSNNFTFAEYARKGFFELIITTLISGSIIFIVQRSYSAFRVPIMIKILQLILAGQVFVVACSAIKRMNLYQDVFGYTVLRLYVEWFLYFLLIIIAFSCVVFVFKKTFKVFFYMSIVMSVIALGVIASFNMDFIIAEKNIDRFFKQIEKNGEMSLISLSLKEYDNSFRDTYIDFFYLQRLSMDAFPAFLKLFNINTFEKLPLSLKMDLAKYVQETKQKIKERSWFEWNIGEQKVLRALDSIDKEMMDSLSFFYENNKKAFELLSSRIIMPKQRCDDFTVVDFSLVIFNFDCVIKERDGQKFAIVKIDMPGPGNPAVAERISYVAVVKIVKENIISAKNIITKYPLSYFFQDERGISGMASDGSVIFSKSWPYTMYISKLVFDEQKNTFFYEKPYFYKNEFDGEIGFSRK